MAVGVLSMCLLLACLWCMAVAQGLEFGNDACLKPFFYWCSRLGMDPGIGLTLNMQSTVYLERMPCDCFVSTSRCLVDHNGGCMHKCAEGHGTQ